MLHGGFEGGLDAAGIFFQLQAAGERFADMPVKTAGDFTQLRGHRGQPGRKSAIASGGLLPGARGLMAALPAL